MYKISQDILTRTIVFIITGKSVNENTILTNANVKLFHFLTILICFCVGFMFMFFITCLINI